MTTPGSDNRIQAASTNHHWGHGGWQLNKNDYEELRQIVQAMNPGAVERAGGAYQQMAGRIAETMDLILDQSQKMAEVWGGEDAEAALQRMNKAYQQAHTIQQVSTQTSSALSGHADMQRRYQREVGEEHWYGTDIGAGGTSTGDWLQGDSHVGREIMERLQADTDTSNRNFPDSIRSTEREDIFDFNPNARTSTQPTSGRTPDSVGPGVSSAGHINTGGDAASGPGALPGGGGVANDPGGSGGGTDLAGYSQPGGGTGSLGGGLGSGGGLGAGGAGALGVGGPGVGPGGGGPGGVVGGFPAGVGGARAGVPGRGGAAGQGGMPMGAGAGRGGGEEEERERITWLTEDKDVWTGDDDVVTPVIDSSSTRNADKE
jgi:uncharacterized protein YukE